LSRPERADEMGLATADRPRWQRYLRSLSVWAETMQLIG
jgi:hypothetical protein